MPLVLVEPFGPGGGVDVIARALAGPLGAALDVPVVVENRPGMGATAAPAFVAGAAPDGRTLLLNTSAHAYSAALARNLPYDPIRDFVPVAPVTSQPYVLVSSRMATLADLVGAADERALTFASAGIGTGTHVGVAQLNLQLGVSATHLPARPTDAIAATIERVASGEVDYAMSPIPIAAPHLASGALVALGVSAARRSPLLPDVPTLEEAGAPGFDFPIWYGVWAPEGIPQPIVERLAAGIGGALAAPVFENWLADHGAQPLRMTQSEFSQFVVRERDRAAAVAGDGS